MCNMYEQCEKDGAKCMLKEFKEVSRVTSPNHRTRYQRQDMVISQDGHTRWLLLSFVLIDLAADFMG